MIMQRVFVWSEGIGTIGNPWLSVANASDQPMVLDVLMIMDDGRRHQSSRTVEPMKRFAMPLSDIALKQHFWMRVQMNQIGAATLTVWDNKYSLPPYTPPPSIYDSATELRLTTGDPQPR